MAEDGQISQFNGQQKALASSVSENKGTGKDSSPKDERPINTPEQAPESTEVPPEGKVTNIGEEKSPTLLARELTKLLRVAKGSGTPDKEKEGKENSTGIEIAGPLGQKVGADLAGKKIGGDDLADKLNSIKGDLKGGLFSEDDHTRQEQAAAQTKADQNRLKETGRDPTKPAA